MNFEYGIPKPKLSSFIWGLIIYLGIGLFGLGIAAYVAFSYLGIVPQSIAYALIIELGGILEAYLLFKGKKSIGIPALLISVIVSISYNFTQASQASANLQSQLSTFELICLSVGPLAAVTSGALMLGNLVREHDQEVAKWQEDKQAWLDQQMQIAQKEKERQESLQARLQYEKQKSEDEARRAKELAEIEANKQIELAKIQSANDTAKRSAKLQEKELQLQEKQLQMQTETAKLQNEIAIAKPSAKKLKGKKEQFFDAVRNNGTHEWTPEIIMEKFGVSQRTAYNWIEELKSKTPQPEMVGVN